MSDEKQTDGIKIEEDLDKLGILEQEFNNIMGNIELDDQLSRFKDHYNELLEAFRESHKNNNLLIEKCRKLNDEIIENSTKVNSVLRLSQDDQRTIAELKFEFEKAWKIVELSQEKENRSKDFIDQLKAESQRLSQLMDKSLAFNAIKGISAEAINKEIASIKEEIDSQDKQFKSLSEECQNWRDKTETSNRISGKYSEESNVMTEELNTLRNKNEELNTEIANLMGQLNAVREINRANSETVSSFPERVNVIKLNIDDLIGRKEIWRQDLKQETDQGLVQRSKVNLNKKLLEDKYESVAKTKENIEKTRLSIEQKESEKSYYNDIFRNISKESANTASELKEIETRHSKCIDDLRRYKERFNECREESYRLQHELIKGESLVSASKRDLQLYEKQNLEFKTASLNEIKNKENVERQLNKVHSNITVTKSDIHKTNVKISATLKEIAGHENTLSVTRANLTMMENYKETLYKETVQADKELRQIHERAAKHDVMHQALVEQRDLLKKQLETLRQKLKLISDGNIVLKNDIASHKDLIRSKDVECLNVHRSSEEIKNFIPVLKEQIEHISKKISEVNMQISQLSSQLVRKRYLAEAAEDKLKEVQLDIQNLRTFNSADKVRAYNKHEEISKLRDKIKGYEHQIKAGSRSYIDLCKRIDLLKEELIKCVAKQKNLKESCKHRVALRKEHIKLEKTLLVSRCRVKGLEEEMETPINVHRWRFLEGTNPEHLILIKMTHNLRNALVRKFATVEKFKNLLESTKEELKKSQERLQNQSVAEQEAKIDYFNGVLHVKRKQLRSVEQNYIGQRLSVNEGKEGIDTLKSQIRDIKLDYYHTKTLNNEFKSNSGIERTVKPQECSRKLIGGGFAISQCNEQRQQPLSPNLRTSVICIPNRRTTSVINNILPNKKPLPNLVPVTD